MNARLENGKYITRALAEMGHSGLAGFIFPEGHASNESDAPMHAAWKNYRMGRVRILTDEDLIRLKAGEPIEPMHFTSNTCVTGRRATELKDSSPTEGIREGRGFVEQIRMLPADVAGSDVFPASPTPQPLPGSQPVDITLGGAPKKIVRNAGQGK